MTQRALIASIVMLSVLILPMATYAKTGSDSRGGKDSRSNASMMKKKHGDKNDEKNRNEKKHMPSGISGTVTAINGTTLTITGSDASSTVYTVNAASSTMKFSKEGTPIPLSTILIGDTVMVKGSTSGTTVIAKSISDSSLIGRNLFMGKVTSVTGTTITIDSKPKGSSTTTTYTINAGASSTIVFGKGTSTVGTIQVGDYLKIFGDLTGTNVIATWIRDIGNFFSHHGWKHGSKH